jgi:hypothetical protein
MLYAMALLPFLKKIMLYAISKFYFAHFCLSVTSPHVFRHEMLDRKISSRQNVPERKNAVERVIV